MPSLPKIKKIKLPDGNTYDFSGDAEDITWAEYQALTPAQQASGDYYITDKSISITQGINDLTDVFITSLTSGQVLMSNANGDFVNTTIGSGAFVDTAWTPTVTSAIGDTSAVIQSSNIHTTSIIEPFSDNPDQDEPTMVVTEGQCALSFEALEVSTVWKLRVTN